MEQNAIIDNVRALAFMYGPPVLMGLLLLFIGLWVIRILTRTVRRILQRKNLDPSLRPFLISIVDVGLKVVLLLMVAGTVGIQTTSFIALFSALALSIGLALQGSLGNFASGVLILLFRPFRVGDLISTEGQTGRVSEIQIFNTILYTTDGRKVIMPNNKLTQNVVVNIVETAPVRVEAPVELENLADLETLKIAARNAAADCLHAASDKEVDIQTTSFSGQSVKATVGIWTTGQFYWETLEHLRAALKKAADKQNLKMNIG